MSARTPESAVVDILYKRYSYLLKDVDIVSMVAYLFEQNLISADDKAGVLKHQTSVNQKKKLSRILTAQGSTKMMLNIQVMVAFKQKSPGIQVLEQGVPVNQLQEAGKPDKPSVHEGNGKKTLSEAQPQEGKRLSLADDDVLGCQLPDASPMRTMGKKCQMNDVPDPPLPARPTPDVDVASKQMEAFVVLFFTFLCQHIQTLQKSAASAFSWLQNDCTLDQIREYFPRHVIQGINPSVENPIQLRLSVVLNAFHQFIDRFEEVVCENKSLASRAKLLQDVMKRSSTLEDEIQEYRRKQSQLGAHRVGHTHDRIHELCKQCEKDQVGLRSKLEALKKQVLELEPLKRALARSEERNKQLVEVTQQWAIECQEKDSHIAVVETQIQQLRQERELFKKKLAKYKKQASVDREQRVSDCQFEELREELGYRRELYDKVVSERDRAEEKVKLLTAENCVLRRQVEEDKDEVEELKDRVGNFKVQMQGREPTVKEFGLVVQENRQLKEENEQLRKENSALSDEILAYKTQMDEHTHAANGREGVQSHAEEHPQTPPRAKQSPAAKLPVKTQAMVTGYTIPERGKPPVVASGVTRSNEELQHDSRAINTTHNAKFQTRPSSAPYPRSPSPPSGSYRRSPTPPARSYQRSPTPPTGSYQRSPTPPTGAYQRSPTPPTVSQQNGGFDQLLPSAVSSLATSTIPNGHFTPETPLRNGIPLIASDHGRDYTTEIRYPNQSGILVQPVHNDDIAILQQEGVFSGGSSSPPRFYDPTPLLPAKTAHTSSPPLSPAAASHYNPPNQPVAMIITPALTSPPLSFTSNERKCPVCQHVFLMLGEREFQSHVAGCFK